MKKNGLIIMLLFFVSLTEASIEKKHHEDKHYKCTYETQQGRFHGLYTSYYKNGQKRAEGYFENNMRSGKWSVWDSTGKLIVQRYYEEPFTVVKHFPPVAKEKPIELLNVPRYSIKKNKDNYVEYFEFDERMVVYSELIFRILQPQGNPLLFENDRLFTIIEKRLHEKEFLAYEDEFMTKEMRIPSFENLQVIAYRVKEMIVFDKERFVSETRFLGLCPVFLNTQSKDTVSLFWLYYPEMRKSLAMESLQNTDLPSKISSFEDLFFYRYFHSMVYKPDPIWGKKPSFVEDWSLIEQESAQVEVQIIELEHDVWIHLAK
jgi:hypothetical protein